MAALSQKPQSTVDCEYVWRRTDRWIKLPWSARPRLAPMSKLAVIYYSATGHGTSMAKRVAAAAEAAGAEVRVRRVAETQEPASFAQNHAWTANYEAHRQLPPATGDDIVWADAVIFGSPTRFGSVASAIAGFPGLARRPVG